MHGHRGAGILTGATYVGFGNGADVESAYENFFEKSKLNKKYKYERVLSKLKPGTEDRWYFEVKCLG